jgi:1-deoxy-D-xylulose-5-phosphate synthase
LGHDAPVSIRYPKCVTEKVDRPLAPIELGRSEVIDWGHDGMFIVFGTLMGACIKATETLRAEGLDVGVINARFAKPLDTETIFRALESCSFVITVEEGCLMGGFGSAVVEAAADAGISMAHVRRLGIPDRFIEHAERGELLSDLGLDVSGLTAAARDLAHRVGAAQTARRQVS